MILHLTNTRLIDPEAGTVEPGSLTLADGVISARDRSAARGAKLAAVMV